MIVSPAAPHDALLTEKDFDAVAGLSVLDQDGNTDVIVLIRHFWCGACQSYVEELAQIPQTNWRRPACDSSSRCEVTGFSGDIYCDPTDKKTQASQLYTALGAVVVSRPANTSLDIKKNFGRSLSSPR
ncbi:hypothetical protein BKA62DRAFT_673335, partial [Auriculariales sp. MPI-PUGE-AT-0066]